MTGLLPARARDAAQDGSGKDVIRLAGGDGYAPFHFVGANGLPDGFDVELARAVARALGIEVEIRFAPWRQARAQVESGAADGLIGMAFSEARADEYLFSTPYLATQFRVFARRGGRLDHLADLAGHRVLVQRDGLAQDYLERSDIGVPMGVETAAVALRRVASGEEDYCVLSEYRGRYVARDLGLDDDLVPVGPPLLPSSYGFALRKDRADLARRIDQGLALVKASGEYDRIYDRWFGVLAPRKPTALEALRVAAWIFAPLLALLVLAIVWTWLLRREVNRQTRALRASEIELRRARDAAEAASHAKSLFLATMSHEIRTPLNGIVGSVELLEGDGDPSRADALDALRSSSDALLAVVSGILDFSRIEAGQLEIEHIAFVPAEIVKGAVRLFDRAAAKKGLELCCEIAPDLRRPALGDPVRIRQIVLNLVGNALKFTESGSIAVTGGVVTGEGGQRMVVQVVDTGIGIPAEAQPALFDAFTQADASTTRRFGGTGLGLAICRRLVTLMGGSIGVASAPGAGSRFWFEVPLVPAPAADQEDDLATRPQSIGFDGLRVLLVEDHPVNRRIASRMLRSIGLEPDEAEDGAVAIAACDAKSYAIVFMDCSMPRVDGFAATREIRLRERPGHRALIVALTANAVAGDRERCLAAGMDDYLTKPVRREDLVAVLGRHHDRIAANAGWDGTSLPSGTAYR